MEKGSLRDAFLRMIDKINQSEDEAKNSLVALFFPAPPEKLFQISKGEK
jgi:hypothetical protein